MKVKRSRSFYKWGEQLQLQSMALPAIALLIIFSYIPMWGVLMSFQEYDILKGFWGSPWVGIEKFQAFFGTRNFYMIMRNTIAISFLKLVFTFPAPIILALMLNEVKQMRVKRTIQTITYLPYFLSWVIVSAMVFSLLSVDSGSVNMLLVATGAIKSPVNWMSRPQFFWPLLVIINLWKNTGYSAIIYLAAIASINPELYESAAVDGAQRRHCIWYITLPSIAPQIIILLILSISNIMNAGFDEIMLLTNDGANGVLRPVAETIDIHVYKMGIELQQFSYATAVGVFKSVINVAMLLIANFTARGLTDTGLW